MTLILLALMLTAATCVIAWYLATWALASGAGGAAKRQHPFPLRHDPAGLQYLVVSARPDHAAPFAPFASAMVA
ncbi:hypothetical protein [Paracoccus versutus]